MCLACAAQSSSAMLGFAILWQNHFCWQFLMAQVTMCAPCCSRAYKETGLIASAVRALEGFWFAGSTCWGLQAQGSHLSLSRFSFSFHILQQRQKSEQGGTGTALPCRVPCELSHRERSLKEGIFNIVCRQLGLLASHLLVQLGIDTGRVHTLGKFPLNFSGRRMKSLSLTVMESKKQKFA